MEEKDAAALLNRRADAALMRGDTGAAARYLHRATMLLAPDEDEDEDGGSAAPALAEA